MASTIFSGNEVKTLKDVLSLNDKAKVIPVNADPTSGAGVTAPIGSLALDYSSGKIYRKTGSLATEWQSLGSGVGGINYIGNSDAESGTTGWATYADAAGSAPVDGTGGTANITWSRSTSSPLRGIADFNLVKDAANRQGEGVSYDFTIDSADLAKVLTVTFDYEIVSGTYANGDLAVYLVQDPTGTPVIIQPAGYQIESATTGTTMREIATFQTSSSGTTYRLCIHVASTSASAYTLAIDNVQVGPQVVQYGAPVTDWVAFTPTGTWTNNTTYAGEYRRVGDSLEVRALVSVSGGAPNAAILRVNLPAGLSIDTTKLATSVAEFTVLGTGGLNDSSTTAHKAYVVYVDATSVGLRYQSAATSSTSASSQVSYNAPFAFNTGDSVNLQFSVPIIGWSSTVQMSNDTDTRVVAVSASRSGTTQSLTGNTTDLIFPTTNFDTHGAYNNSTGAFIAPVSGYYTIGGSLSITTSASVSFYAYVNGVRSICVSSALTQADRTAFGTVRLNARDSLTIRADTNCTLNSVRNDITINRLSGPSAIAASETVAARYTIAAAVNSSTTQPINYATKVFDTHGAVTTGASWKFTAPISGLYLVQASGACASSSAAFYIYKNGSFAIDIGSQLSSAALSQNGIIQLNAGDYIDMRYSTSLNTTGTTTQNWMAVTRIGN